MSVVLSADWREIERLATSPLDPERELARVSRWTHAVVDGRVVRVPRICGGSGITGTWSEIIYANDASGTAKNTFTTEAVINDTAGMGPQPTLPAYFWGPSPNLAKGRVLKVVARGIVSSTATPTFQWFCRLGSAASTAGPNIGSTSALTTLTTITNQLWEFEMDCVMRTPGATGGNSTVMGLGVLACGGGLAAPGTYSIFGGGASPGTVATVDISIINYVNLTAACSASSSSNSIQVLQLIVGGMN